MGLRHLSVRRPKKTKRMTTINFQTIPVSPDIRLNTRFMLIICATFPSSFPTAALHVKSFSAYNTCIEFVAFHFLLILQHYFKNSPPQIHTVNHLSQLTRLKVSIRLTTRNILLCDNHEIYKLQ